MLATLPKLADRAFVVGFLLPSLIFGVVLLALFGNGALAGAVLAPAKEGNTGFVLVLAAGIWLLAVFMLILNHALYRSLEGYLPPLSWLRGRRRHYALRITRVQEEAALLSTRWRAEGDAFLQDDRGRYRDLMLKRAALPALASDALPTAFGNAIKAFEIYPREVYGADGVTLWLRLAAVTEKSLLDAVTDGRSQIDFMVNGCFFAGVIAVCGAGRAVHALDLKAISSAAGNGGVMAAVQMAPWGGFAAAAGAAGVAFVCYRSAVALVPAWGEMVKACFDMGLPDLAAKAGYRLPETAEARRRFWGAFSQTLIYRTNPDGTSILRPEDWQAAEGPAPKVVEAGAGGDADGIDGED